MIYTVARAQLITEQLRRFTTSENHHVSSHVANLGFWLDEAAGALDAIDQHRTRLEAMRSAQQAWVERHETEVPVYGFCGICGGKCEFDDGSMTRPRLPRDTAGAEKKEARRELVDAVYYFLARCCRLGLVSRTEMRQHCERFGTSIDPADLETKH